MKISKKQLKQIIREEYSKLKRKGLISEIKLPHFSRYEIMRIYREHSARGASLRNLIGEIQDYLEPGGGYGPLPDVDYFLEEFTFGPRDTNTGESLNPEEYPKVSAEIVKAVYNEIVHNQGSNWGEPFIPYGTGNVEWY